MIIETKFKARNQKMLETGVFADFNGYSMAIEAESIMVKKKSSKEFSAC